MKFASWRKRVLGLAVGVRSAPLSPPHTRTDTLTPILTPLPSPLSPLSLSSPPHFFSRGERDGGGSCGGTGARAWLQCPQNEAHVITIVELSGRMKQTFRCNDQIGGVSSGGRNTHAMHCHEERGARGGAT